jgi:preprotein translocase subunit YajC
MKSLFASQSPASPQSVGQSFDPLSFLPIILIFIVVYFLILRPQQKKMKEHQKTLQDLKKGDKIVTSGGIIGNVSQILNDKEILVEISDHVRVHVLRSMVTDVLREASAIPQQQDNSAT